MGAETIVEVVVDNLMRLVESAQRVETLPPDQHASTGNRHHVALGACEPEIAGVVSGRQAKSVPGQAKAG